MTLKFQWETALASLRIVHPDPSTNVTLHVYERERSVRVQFNFTSLVNARAPGRHELLEYYFTAEHFPGIPFARLWVIAVWALFMEHEAMELAYLGDEQLIDPHTSDYADKHRAALDNRHNMTKMLGRLWTEADEDSNDYEYICKCVPDLEVKGDGACDECLKWNRKR